MSHWPFIIGSYALALIGTFGLTFWSYSSMRRAESEAESLRRER